MKHILFALLFTLLIACAPIKEEKQETPITTEQVKVETPVEEPIEEKIETPVEQPIIEEKTETPTTTPKTEPVKTQTTATVPMDPKIKDLLRKVDEKIKSISYLYGGSETGNLFLDTYNIKGDNIRINKYEEDTYVMEGYYDTVYVQLGIGCCEKQTRCKSHNVDNTNQKFEVDTTKLNMPKTPMQWTKEIPATAKIIGPQTVDERSVTYITYTQDGADYEMWLDDTYGAAHKVIIKTANGDIVYKYNDMKFNMLEESDFNPPCD